MERKTYREKLLDPRWQRRRLEILGAADFACRDCGSKTKTLHVHHVRYLPGREPWEYEDDLLRCVCDDCHTEHRDADEQLRGDMEDLEKVLRGCGLRSKYEAANAAHVIASLILVHGDLGAIGLAHALVELNQGLTAAQLGEWADRADGLYRADGGRFLSGRKTE